MTTDPLPTANARRFAALAACIGWTALALQLVLSIGLATTGGRSAAWGVFMYLGYFTILTNLLVALASTAGALRADGAFWRFFRKPGVASAIAANIAVVGLVYFFVLRHLWSPQGLAWLADALLHYLMPVVFLTYWWIAVPASGLRWRDIPRWWIYPLGYLAYALVRGAGGRRLPVPVHRCGRTGLRPHGDQFGRRAHRLLAGRRAADCSRTSEAQPNLANNGRADHSRGLPRPPCGSGQPAPGRGKAKRHEVRAAWGRAKSVKRACTPDSVR